MNIWQETAHYSHEDPNHERGEALMNAVRWTVGGIVVFGVISGLTGFKPGMDFALALLKQHPGKPF